MHARISHLMTLALIVATWPVVSAQASTIHFYDTFENGPGGEVSTRNDASPWDDNDLIWWRVNNKHNMAVVNDAFAGGGSQRALAVTLGTDGLFGRIVAPFSPVSLGVNAGDVLQLTFDMRISNGTIPANVIGFRFGLYNGNGTTYTTEASLPAGSNAAETNDVGYHVRIGTGNVNSGSPSANLFGIIQEGAGDNVLGGNAAFESDLSNGNETFTTINDQNKHSFALRLTRTLTGVNLDLLTNNTLIASGSVASLNVSSFDHLYFGTGNVGLTYNLDNVKLESIPIPEPATLMLAFASLALIRTRRHHC
jgi:hypothetical protein